MSKDAFYFPHFSNARQDRKILRIRKELGIEGYGIYFMLLEVLRDQDGFKFPMDDIDLLADEFNTSEAKIRTVIANYKLFELDEDENFFSTKFDEFMQPYLKMKEQRRNAGIASGKKRKLLSEKERPFNDRSTTDEQSKVKESKVKEKKVNKSKIEIPAYEDFRNYALQKKSNIDTSHLKLKYDAWVENGWKDGNNKNIINWKSKINNTLPFIKETKKESYSIDTDMKNNPDRMKF